MHLDPLTSRDQAEEARRHGTTRPLGGAAVSACPAGRLRQAHLAAHPVLLRAGPASSAHATAPPRAVRGDKPTKSSGRRAWRRAEKTTINSTCS